MRVENIHERELHTSKAHIGALIDSLASKEDRLWPSQTWPRMRFDRPLGVGASGGHGPIRYQVEAYDPGLSIKFRFTGPRGFNGYHGFSIVRQDDHPIKLRHIVEMNTRGVALFSWPLLIQPLHDALLEDALTQAEASTGSQPTVKPWPSWVRIVRWLLTGGKARSQMTAEDLIQQSRVNTHSRSNVQKDSGSKR